MVRFSGLTIEWNGIGSAKGEIFGGSLPSFSSAGMSFRKISRWCSYLSRIRALLIASKDSVKRSASNVVSILVCTRGVNKKSYSNTDITDGPDRERASRDLVKVLSASSHVLVFAQDMFDVLVLTQDSYILITDINDAIFLNVKRNNRKYQTPYRSLRCSGNHTGPNWSVQSRD